MSKHLHVPGCEGCETSLVCARHGKTTDDVIQLCKHEHVVPEPIDQTLGVACTDCGSLLGVCWSDEHVSEELWNRACENDLKLGPTLRARRCEQDRPDFCCLCGEQFEVKPGDQAR